MARGGSSGRGGDRIGIGSEPPRRPDDPFFLSEEERTKWGISEGARKRSTRRWTNWGWTPLGKLARYANNGEGSSSGGCRRPRSPSPPVADDSSKEEEEEDAPPKLLDDGDYVHDDEEEAAAIQQASIISIAEARAKFRHDEADAIRQVCAYESAQKDAQVRRVKCGIIDLDDK